MHGSNQVKRDKDKSDLMPGSKELIGSQALMFWARDAVDTVDWPGKTAQFHDFPVAELMILEVYCTAKGAVGSDEMEEWVDTNPVLGDLFPQSHPKSAVIMAFRKCHRQEIQECVGRVLDTALKARFGDDEQHQTPIDYCVVRSLDSWFNPRCGPNPDREAKERVDILGWTDSMSGSS